MTLKPMTHEIRTKIKRYIKNRIDISDIIKDIDIKGEDLSYAIIETFNRVSDNLSGTRFSHASIGKEGRITNLSGTKMINCRFDDTIFRGMVYMRRCDCHDSDFSGAVLTNVEYQYSNFENCKFCETCIRIGTKYSAHSKFSANLFQDLGKMWNLKIEEIT